MIMARPADPRRDDQFQDRLVEVLACKFVTGHQPNAARSRLSASARTSGRLQKAQRTKGRPAAFFVVEDFLRGIATTPARVGRSRQKFDPAGVAERTDIGGQEVRGLRR